MRLAPERFFRIVAQTLELRTDGRRIDLRSLPGFHRRAGRIFQVGVLEISILEILHLSVGIVRRDLQPLLERKGVVQDRNMFGSDFGRTPRVSK